MGKTANIGVRVDEELKNESQKVLDELGIPMSLAIELFLKQVVAKRQIPFPVGVGAAPDAEREESEREFWRSFITWYFDVWPRFDSEAVAKRAADELGFTGEVLGTAARRYVDSEDESFAKMTEEQRAAYHEISAMQCLLADAKELIYWALGMERLFVPALSGRCADEADQWRWQRLWSKQAESFWVGHLAEVGILSADSLEGVAGRAALPDEKLMELCRDWLDDLSCDDPTYDRLRDLAWEVSDPDKMQDALEEAGLLDEFEVYVMEQGQETPAP